MISLGFNRPGADIYIDLGTANTLVMTKDRGLVANEPSVVAYRDHGSGRKEVVAVGNEAKAKIGRTPGNLVAAFPLRAGVIADLDSTEAMLRYFMGRARRRLQFAKPRVVISLPYGVTDIEKKAVRDAGLAAGARDVVLIDEPMAAAIGAGLPIEAPKGNMIIDIGGGTTEVAVISLYGIVHCEAVRVGGHEFDHAIVEYVRRQANLIVGDQSAERVKMKIATALQTDERAISSIKGIDHVSGLPREVSLTCDHVYDAISNLLKEIYEAGRRALEQIPPELLPDIIRDGVSVVGGGALIRGIDQRLSRELQVPVRVAQDPLLAIARGGHRTLCEPELLERIALA
jgi:rod shape-determining protein MreB